MGDGIHVGTWLYSSTTQAKATVFSVIAGRTTTARDVKLAVGGKISGVVSDARTGAPVPNAYVTVDDYNPRSGPLPGPRSAQTDSAGRYTLGGLASGDYTPLTYEETGDYGFEWTGNADSKATATPVSVRVGRTTTYDIALDPAAILTGDALDPTGQPSTSYTLVDAFTATGDPVGWSTDVRSDGTFRITGLPGGTTYLRLTHFDPSGGSVVVWHDAATSRQLATAVPTTSGQTTSITTHVTWS
jgi:Carboxypeptidase regulatory-like domain